ncbi:OB-fold nucleic acid binding domain-containing protein [Roseibium sp. AS2]|uniref:OB-fold nucleic acid binding domain-containing protein n=1 Tax=Roseibium sp. AS2 TaxID=3135781 RepID=UPI00316FA012
MRLRTGVASATLERLAEADAFAGMGLSRRAALWQVKTIRSAKPLPLFNDPIDGEAIFEPEVHLPAMHLGQEVVEDYLATRLTLRAHPMELLRPHIPHLTPHERLAALSPREARRVSVCGLVITRQRPGTASGVIFLTLEDETGVSNVVVWPKIYEKYRPAVLGGRLVKVTVGGTQFSRNARHRVTPLSVLRTSLPQGGRGVQRARLARTAKPKEARKRATLPQCPCLLLDQTQGAHDPGAIFKAHFRRPEEPFDRQAEFDAAAGFPELKRRDDQAGPGRVRRGGRVQKHGRDAQIERREAFSVSAHRQRDLQRKPPAFLGMHKCLHPRIADHGLKRNGVVRHNGFSSCDGRARNHERPDEHACGAAKCLEVRGGAHPEVFRP